MRNRYFIIIAIRDWQILFLIKMNKICLICDQSIDSDFVIVKKGINSLIKASEERGDKKCERFKSSDSIFVHENCRNLYVKKNSIAAFNRKRRNDGINDF